MGGCLGQLPRLCVPHALDTPRGGAYSLTHPCHAACSRNGMRAEALTGKTGVSWNKRGAAKAVLRQQELAQRI